MNKLSVFVAIATLSLAAPALAQTPSDIRNGRSTVPEASSSEVHLDRHNSSAMHNGESNDGVTSEGTTKHHGKKHHGKKHHSAGAKKHHGKKHHHKKADDAATTESK